MENVVLRQQLTVLQSSVKRPRLRRRILPLEMPAFHSHPDGWMSRDLQSGGAKYRAVRPSFQPGWSLPEGQNRRDDPRHQLSISTIA